jgi:copper(I)-binding protein
MRFLVAAAFVVAVAVVAPVAALGDVQCAYMQGTVQHGWTPTTALTYTNQSIFHTNGNNGDASYTGIRLRSDGTIAWQGDVAVGDLFSPYNSIDVLRKSRL